MLQLQDIIRVAMYQDDAVAAYVQADPVDVGSDIHYTLKFRTKRSNAMLMYVADDKQVKILMLDAK